MKRIALLSFCVALIMLSACNQSKLNEMTEVNTELTDSLKTANAEKDSLLALLNELSDGMAQIKEMEKLLGSNLDKETPDRKEEIKSDMLLIQQAMEARRKKLEELEAKLRKSANYNAEMKKTIESLRSQIEAQESTIASLQEELKKAHVEIDNLNMRVDSLSLANSNVTKEKEEAESEALQLANQLNTCYYVIGSKSELKKYKIIETGFLRKTKILEGDFEKSYFTKADKRTLTEISLHTQKAKVLSNHPADSYRLATIDGTLVLEILNPSEFWERSNFLVIQID